MAAAPKAAPKQKAAPERAWSPVPLAPWEQQFVELLNNQAEPKQRQHGFLVVVRDTTSLQPLQAACSKQTWNNCLTARFRLERGPVFGTLFRAFVDAALAGGMMARPPEGDYDPRFPSGRWPDVLRPVAERLGRFYGSGNPPPQGQMTEAELDELFAVLADDAVLGRGDRLVLFAEVAGESEGAEWMYFGNAVLPRLPERVGIVVSNPSGDAPWPVVSSADPHALELDDVPVEGPDAYRYRLSALRGDQPSATDLLGFAGYADALARFVLMKETDPLTIGIHGPWGKGKSSFMTQVEQGLKEHKQEEAPVVSVWFNAWRFQDATQTWAGLASTISREIESALPLRRRLWSPVAYAWRERRARLVLDLLVPSLLLVVAVAILAVAGWDELDGWASRELGPTWGPLVPAGALAFVAVGLLASRLNRIVRPVSERLLEYVRLPDHRDNMGYQYRVLDDLRFIRGRLPANARVVVFVDDLDRCSDEKIMEILQAIHLILGESGFYVFLGIDTVMIYRAIEGHYPNETGKRPLERDFPERYLRKIVQLPFHLPETSTTEVFLKSLFSEPARLALEPPAELEKVGPAGAGDGFAYDLGTLSPPVVEVLREVEDTPDELQAFLDLRQFCADNPRELKRLVNVHRLVKILIQRPDAPMPEPLRRKLVKWLVFCAAWPDLVDDALRYAKEHPTSPDVLSGLGIGMRAFAKHVDKKDGKMNVLTAEDLAPGGMLALAAELTQLVLPDALPIADADEDGAASAEAETSPAVTPE